MKKTTQVYVFSVLCALLIGALGSIITSNGMMAYDQAIKPSFTPPDWVFPVVWSILYSLMGIGFARILLQGAGNQRKAILVYGTQLLVNFLWTVLFFGFHMYGLAAMCLAVLWVLILAMCIAFYRIEPIAGLLQIPYLLWVSFAGYLNVMIWLLN